MICCTCDYRSQRFSIQSGALVEAGEKDHLLCQRTVSACANMEESCFGPLSDFRMDQV